MHMIESLSNQVALNGSACYYNEKYYDFNCNI
jgi:hypothetical protein